MTNVMFKGMEVLKQTTADKVCLPSVLIKEDMEAYLKSAGKLRHFNVQTYLSRRYRVMSNTPQRLKHYAAFMQSTKWQEIRTRKIAAAGGFASTKMTMREWINTTCPAGVPQLTVCNHMMNKDD